MNAPITKSPDWALITGGSGGIGYELARLLARDGCNLVLVARDEKRLEEAAGKLEREFNVVALTLQADLADPASPVIIHDWLKDHDILCSVLINNAGFDVYGRFSETQLGREVDMIQVNILALTKLTKLVLADMLAAGRGRILNLGSTGSFIGSPLNIVYCATKAYVLSFSEGLAEELAGSGVSVTCLCPGATRTEFHSRAGMESIAGLKLGWADAAQVAKAGYQAMRRGQRVLVTGGNNKMLLFFSRFMPRALVTRMAMGFMKSE